MDLRAIDKKLDRWFICNVQDCFGLTWHIIPLVLLDRKEPGLFLRMDLYVENRKDKLNKEIVFFVQIVRTSNGFALEEKTKQKIKQQNGNTFIEQIEHLLYTYKLHLVYIYPEIEQIIYKKK